MLIDYSQSQACPLWTGALCPLKVFRLWLCLCKEKHVQACNFIYYGDELTGTRDGGVKRGEQC